MSRLREWTCGASAVVLVAFSTTVWAQPGDNTAAAESLREEGSRLLAEGNYELACAKLKASMDLRESPFTGGRLAQCYEKLDRLASAWAQWRAVVVLIGSSTDTMDQQRKTVARARAAELDPQVARLIIAVAADHRIAGLTVRRDGESVTPGAWGSAVRIDAGTYEISASAPDHKDWTAKVTVQNGAAETVQVPKLEPAPVVKKPAHGVLGPEVPQQTDPSPWMPASPQAWAAVGVGVGGVVALGIGSYLGINARGIRDDARDLGCDKDNVCPTQEGVDRVEKARGRANLSTVAFVVGAVAIGGGVVLWMTAPDPGASELEGSKVELAPAVAPDFAGAVIRGSF